MTRTTHAWPVFVMALWMAAPANAFVLTLVPVRNDGFGGILSFDVFLDTEGESGIVILSAGLTFDPTIAAYSPVDSAANDYYPLYAPGQPAGKVVAPATWLEPFFNPPAESPGPLPPIGAQVNLDFGERNLNPTIATASNLWLGTLSFVLIGPGVSWGEWKTNSLIVNGIEVGDSVTMVGSPEISEFVVPVPEPTTALLMGAGLAAIGLGVRHRARR